MFSLKSLEAIKGELAGANSPIRNFPKSITFPFADLYQEIVTKIKSSTISSECILYDSDYAYNITVSYWNDSEGAGLKNYWFIGQNGQGDYWVMDRNGEIYFYDHGADEAEKNNFVCLHINFGQWLQFAYLNKALDEIYFAGKYNEKTRKDYAVKLGEISKGLLGNYPFELKGM
jgi:hypothetical protein